MKIYDEIIDNDNLGELTLEMVIEKTVRLTLNTFKNNYDNDSTYEYTIDSLIEDTYQELI